MGLLDFLFGKKHTECSGCGCSIHKNDSLCLNCQILKEAEKRNPKVKKPSDIYNTLKEEKAEKEIKKKKSAIKANQNKLNKFSQNEQSDLRVYALIRCLAEMMKADGEVDHGELEFMAKFSKEAQKNLSKPYDISSKEGKFVWGNSYKSESTNRKNFISVIKTHPKKELDKFFEKIIVMAVADRNLDNRESQYLIRLCADIYGVSKTEAKDIAGAHLKKLGLIK